MRRIKDFLTGAFLVIVLLLVYGSALMLGYVDHYTPTTNGAKFDACIDQVRAGNGSRFDCFMLLGDEEATTNLAEVK
jgi:hypothetical protein